MILLREFREEDIPKLINWIPNEKFLLTWGGPAYKFPLTFEQVESEMKAAKKSGSKLFFAVIDSTLNEVIGHIELLGIDKGMKTAYIGRVLVGNKDSRNKGIGLEIIKHLLIKCFEELKLEKIRLNVFEYNRSAIACYKKVGFEIEKVMKDAREYHGEKFTLIYMTINLDKFNKMK